MTMGGAGMLSKSRPDPPPNDRGISLTLEAKRVIRQAKRPGFLRFLSRRN